MHRGVGCSASRVAWHACRTCKHICAPGARRRSRGPAPTKLASCSRAPYTHINVRRLECGRWDPRGQNCFGGRMGGWAGGRDFRCRTALETRKQCRMIYRRKMASFSAPGGEFCGVPQKEGGLHEGPVPISYMFAPLASEGAHTGAKAKLCHQPLASRPLSYLDKIEMRARDISI